MNIFYVAKHFDHDTSNDDEGAITHALRQLGHQIWCADELTVHRDQPWKDPQFPRIDMVLFHKWRTPHLLRKVSDAFQNCPIVCWYFDRVISHDPFFRDRDRGRQAWMYEVLPHVTHAFCTDGDWIQRCHQQFNNSPHFRLPSLHWLMQGADERYTQWQEATPTIDILYVGNILGERTAWWQALKQRYGNRLHHIPRGVHQHDLRRMVQRSRVVVCPPTPISHCYWSNRVYLMAGFGGYVLHPHTDGIMEHYEDGLEIHLYHTHDMSQLHELISYGTRNVVQNTATQRAAYQRTQRQHLYRHRVEQLLGTVFPQTTTVHR